MDCVWTLPKIDYEFIPTIAVGSNSSGELLETFYMISTHENEDRVIRLENGLFEAVYYPEDKVKMPHIILHYHKMRNHDPYTGEEQSAPSYFKVILSSHYNVTKYEEACDCFNRTISVDPKKELVFASPRYPLHYCNNLHCRTTFEAPAGYRVVFRPYKISLEDGDFLRLYEVIDGVEYTREKYTGRYLDGFTTESRANNLIAVFTSDASINYAGFNSSVYAQKIDDDSPDYFDDSPSQTKSRAWLWMILLCLIIVGALVGGAVYRKRTTNGISLSFAPVSFMSGGDYDDGSVNIYETPRYTSFP
ncbi:hypothetical protein PRIPAC_75511 [Pristionchus pacificus]|nr:hypothetical protein PRIPAC_75511 [Pristionchus pacificus]